jgi:hypothetical protein
LTPLGRPRREPAPGVDLGFPSRRPLDGPLVRRERDGRARRVLPSLPRHERPDVALEGLALRGP